jgi:hypothetical protein
LRESRNAAADFVDAPVARGFGKKIAFIDPDRSLTYAELQGERAGSRRRCKVSGCGRKSAWRS